MRVVLVVGCAVLFVAFLWKSRSPPPSGGRIIEERPRDADAFIDSVGVNIHSTYSDTAYADRARVVRALSGLGVGHVRDGLEPDRPDQREYLLGLARRRIRTTFIMGSPRDEVLSRLDDGGVRDFVARTSAALEGPNEYDVAGDPDWVGNLRTYQQRLYRVANAGRRLASRPIVAPSFVESGSRSDVGDLAAWLDLANLHPYPGGRPPEEGVAEELRSVEALSGGKPVVATETGYHNALAAEDGQPPASERAVATYLPRLLLENWRRGIRRTFLYELVDPRADPRRNDPDANFGLLRSDFTPKPGYSALRNLLWVLAPPSDRHTTRRRRSTPRPPLRFSLDAPRNVRHVLLDRTATRYLAIWRPVKVWDESRRVDLPAEPVTVRVRFADPPDTIEVFRPTTSKRAVARADGRDGVDVELTGDVAVLRLRR